MLVAVTLSAMIIEGAGIDWSAIYMQDVFEASPLLSGFAVALGAWAQAVTRFFADPFVERYSSTAVARFLLGCSARAFCWCFSPRVAGWRWSALR